MNKNETTKTPQVGGSVLNDGLYIEKEDKRFVCKCGSKDVVLRPMYGSVSRCRKCNNMWSNA